MWVHGLNTKSPWNFVRDIISKDYHRFQPIPWFIGEYGASGQDEDTIRADLESMEAHALEDIAFVGAAFLQFQTNYKKGGVGMDFGMFGLGKERLAETGEVCQPGAGCRKFPVHCLTTKLSWLPGSKAHRAQAVASAWGGSVDYVSLCSDERRLQTVGELGLFRLHSTLTHSENESPTKQRHGSMVVVMPCSGISVWQTQLHGRWPTSLSEIPQRSLCPLGRSGWSLVWSPCY